MRTHLTRAASTLVPALLILGCGELSQPTEPRTASAALTGALASLTHPHATTSTRLVSMMDACDPETFNTAIGPGTCSQRLGGVTFSQFIAELTRTQRAGAWQFAPLETIASVGQTLLAVNRGGEVHTFTRVAAFGGGIVPPLNELSGNPVPAPECLTLGQADFVAPGATYDVEIGAGGTQLFECCIHPWMRTSVRVR